MIESNFDEMNKPSFKPKFVSEFSMGLLDFERYQDWLKFIEKYSGEINATAAPTLEQCQNYFAGINVLYKNWRAVMSLPQVINELDAAILSAKTMKRIWERNQKLGQPTSSVQIMKLVDLLDSIHTRLMEIKQVIGLGIQVKRNYSTEEKIKRGIHGDKNFSNLPEA